MKGQGEPERLRITDAHATEAFDEMTGAGRKPGNGVIGFRAA